MRFKERHAMKRLLSAGMFLWALLAVAFAQDTKISALASGSPPQATDAIPIARAGANYRLAVSDFQSALGWVSVKDYGAVGNGSADDTTALQDAFDSGNPIIIPNGTYKITSTITIPDGSYVFGSGYTAVISASSVSGSAVSIPQHLGSSLTTVVGNFRISGTATTGLSVNEEEVHLFDIHLTGTFTDGFKFTNTFGSTFENLRTNGATISGKDFWVGEGYSANVARTWYTSDWATYNFYIDNGGGDGISGNSFIGMTAQGGVTGLYLGATNGNTITGFYSENVVHPIVLGTDASALAKAAKFIGCAIGGPSGSHPNYSSRDVLVDVRYADAVSFDDCDFTGAFGVAAAAPISFSGGGGSGAAAIAFVTPAGLLSSISVIAGGSGYSSDPTVVIGGAGSSGAASVTRNGTVVESIAVTNQGSGYGIAAMPPLRFRNSSSGRIRISNPGFNSLASAIPQYSFWPWVVRHTSAESSIGVEVVGDIAPVSGYYGTATMVKKQNYGYDHWVSWRNTSGVDTGQSRVPPVYP